MAEILLVIIIGLTAVSSLSKPWIGIIAYYLLALLGPQYVWWWNFRDLHVSLIVAVCTMVGFALMFLKGKIETGFIKTRQNRILFGLWCFLVISYFFGPFVASNNTTFNPTELINRATKIYLFYFISVLLINDIKKLYYLSLIIIVTTLFYIYWSNMQYVSGNWTQFNMGRLMGPTSVDGGGIYSDENNFAMLFVTGIPFIYFLSQIITRKLIRYSLLCCIPLGWHSVFLTGSRGGLLGLGVVTVIGLLYSKRITLIFIMLLIFVGFYQWQAGNTMKQRSETITAYQGESSAEARIRVWTGGIKMLGDNPITGVGIGSFMFACPKYVDGIPLIAHNTLVQYFAESGIGAGVCYVFIISNFVYCSKKLFRWVRANKDNEDIDKLKYLLQACTTSFAGLITCSMFLSLNYFEVYYYLLIIINALSVLYIMNNDNIDQVSEAA